MCAFESCDNKPCCIEYIGGTRCIHDYCGKQQANKHRERMEAVWPGTYEFLNRSIHYQYLSLDCDQFHQHYHQGGHGHRLHTQTSENIISLHRCVYAIVVLICMPGNFWC